MTALVFLLSSCSGKKIVFSTPQVRFKKNLALRFKDVAQLPARYPGTPNHEKAQSYIESVLSKDGWVVYGQEFSKLYKGRRIKMKNIAGYRKGEKDKLILLGTHYDTRRFADKEKEIERRREPVPGANDGSSGTAVLLSLADFFKQKHLPVSLLLTFFDGEDQGDIEGWQYSLGASKFAESPNPDLPDTVVVVDMICDPKLTIYYEKSTKKAYPQLYEDIWKVAKKLNTFEFINKPKYSILDDHIPFARLGIPAALVIDLDYPHWHKVSDTAEQCSLESMGKVGRVLIQWINEQ